MSSSFLEAERAGSPKIRQSTRLLLDHSPEMIVLSPFDSSRRYVFLGCFHKLPASLPKNTWRMKRL